MHRTKRQRFARKETKDLNTTTNEPDLTDIYRISHPKQNIHSPQPHIKHSEGRPYVRPLNKNFKKFERTEIWQLFLNKEMTLEIKTDRNLGISQIDGN